MSQLMKNWEGLESGDSVALVAPASRCGKAELEVGLLTLKNWGLNPILPKNIFSKSPFCSNSDEKRLQFLKSAFYDDDIKAVLCVRGGYGSQRLVPGLAKLKAPKHFKPLIGYSDITTLHTWLSQNWDWPSIHGPLLCELGSEQVSTKSQLILKNILFKKTRQIEFPIIQPINQLAKEVKNQKGLVAGGNLTVLQSGIGTSSQLVSRNKWIILEEVGERGYRVDRMLNHLHQTQCFKGTKGIIFSSFIGGKEPDGKSLAKKSILDFAQKNKYPCFSGLKVGHGFQNWPILFNTPSRLEKAGPGFQLVQEL